MPIIPDHHPSVDNTIELTRYLNRLVADINLALQEVHYFSPRNTFPNKYRVGELFYFADAIPTTPITGEGLWIYKSTGWIQII